MSDQEKAIVMSNVECKLNTSAHIQICTHAHITDSHARSHNISTLDSRAHAHTGILSTPSTAIRLLSAQVLEKLHIRFGSYGTDDTHIADVFVQLVCGWVLRA